MMMHLLNFEVEHGGKEYKYDVVEMYWYIDGKLSYPKQIPSEVKNLREKLIDTASEFVA